jgi:hypothetical protein
MLIIEKATNTMRNILYDLYADDMTKNTEYLANLKYITPPTRPRGLLGLWQDYYDYRPRDCLSLEYTTKIRFRVWLDIVKEIVAYGILSSLRSQILWTLAKGQASPAKIISISLVTESHVSIPRR